MKTKNKILTLVEIAIVLCSVFLMALPGTVIAAEQDDYVLGVYGNANEDDTIDMRDLTYVKLIFFGKKPETELADAKYDGKINPLDFIQIKLIIVGKEKELTIVDSADRIVTVKKPVKRIVVLDSYSAEAIRAVGAKDEVVGVSDLVNKRVKLFPDLSKLPCVGTYMIPDAEKIAALDPDIVFVAGEWQMEHLKALESADIAIAMLRFHEPAYILENMRKLGYILESTKEVDRYFEWHDKRMGEIKSKVSEIPEDKKPRVLIEYGGTTTSREVPDKGKGLNLYCMEAGGISITAELVGKTVEVEWILEQNPDVIVRYARTGGGGYEIDDVTMFKAHHDEIIALPGFKNIAAVKDGRVHVIFSGLTGGPGYFVTHAYFVKWFHPDLLLDPQAIHQEYLDEFCGIDFNVKKQGVFVYPPLAS